MVSELYIKQSVFKALLVVPYMSLKSVYTKVIDIYSSPGHRLLKKFPIIFFLIYKKNTQIKVGAIY